MRPGPWYLGCRVRFGRVPLVVVLVSVIGLATAACGTPGSRTGVASGAQSTECIADPDAELKDIDEDDSPESPWPHTPGQETVVYFETGELTSRYAGFVEKAAAEWSRSPCIDARAVDECPSRSNCSTIELKQDEGDGETDGESTSRDRNGVRQSNELTFYTGLLDKTSDNGALATVTHEMGHALGLVHRLDKDDLMNAYTDDDTDPVPDEVDFHNLLVLYGGASADNG